MIPKVIHYCWFGDKKKPKLIKDCIKSWNRYLPDYEIVEWNEKNTDLTIPFVREAYRLKKWAFVADYIRLKVLYENGGIYLDTDMMVLKAIDSLLTSECFFGAQDSDLFNGAIIGSVKGNEFIRKCFLKYEYIDLNKKTNWGEIAIPFIITEVFRNNYNFFLPFDKIVKRDKIIIYPYNYFYPLPYAKKLDRKNYRNYLTMDSFSIHFWSESWLDNKYGIFEFLRFGQFYKRFKRTIRNIIKEKTNQ